jgi:aryl-alcohol dehydrogenase-like predicted oxidoreductase
MRYRKLGRTGIEVSEIGFGAWGIGGKQWLGGSDDESLAALRRSIELGLNFIDTALAYGDGHSEHLVGRVVREARGPRVYIATKAPPKNRIWPAGAGSCIEDVLPYDYIVRSAEESLRNLGTGTIDLFQLHVWNAEWTPREEWRRAFEDLKRSGKIAAAGISITEHEPDTALDAVRTGLVDAVQVIYNVFDRSPERNLFPLCEREEVGVLARVPLDEGALAGTVDENTKFPPGDFREWYFRGDRKKQVAGRVAALKSDLGSDAGRLPDLALRFCLEHPAVSTVIPGMRTVRHAEENAALPDLGPLAPATLATLRRHAWDRNFYL